MTDERGDRAPDGPWAPELRELQQRRRMARAMGGEERVERQHSGGRLTVRERIERLLDKDSFVEVGSVAGLGEYDANGRFVSLTAANCVTGRGEIDGRKVVVEGDDFSIRGGSADAAIWEKLIHAEQMAASFRLPIVRLLEGSGGGGSVKTIEKSGRTNLPNGSGPNTGFHHAVQNMARVPIVGMALGSVAGLGAARLTASHYSVIVKKIASVFVAGPPVVARLGEQLTKEQLGGWKIQAEAGTVDDVAEDEEDAFRRTRRFLSYLPSSVWELPKRDRTWDLPDREEDYLRSAVPRDRKGVYNARRIVESVVDRDSFFEIGKAYGRAVITGLARLDGWPVALLASDPVHGGGAWDAAACNKLVRFLELAETFHLPVVNLVDCPGFQVGLAAEKSGLIRLGSRAIAAINQTTVPWCSIIIRNVFGVGGGAHRPISRFVFRYAWPSARWGSLPLEGGIEVAYKTELDGAADKQQAIGEIEARLEALQSPFRTAEAFWVEEIIDPLQTRKYLCEFANLAAALVEPGPAKFAIRP